MIGLRLNFDQVGTVIRLGSIDSAMMYVGCEC